VRGNLVLFGVDQDDERAARAMSARGGGCPGVRLAW
jgi:hypothetical protein